MTNPEINIVDSILTVKASGTDLNINHDLELPQGKSIAQLLYDQENTEIPQEEESC
jgi:hypothetical protein